MEQYYVTILCNNTMEQYYHKKWKTILRHVSNFNRSEKFIFIEAKNKFHRIYVLTVRIYTVLPKYLVYHYSIPDRFLEVSTAALVGTILLVE